MHAVALRLISGFHVNYLRGPHASDPQQKMFKTWLFFPLLASCVFGHYVDEQDYDHVMKRVRQKRDSANFYGGKNGDRGANPLMATPTHDANDCTMNNDTLAKVRLTKYTL
ncbi:hypothetical protein L596_016306 [Steinernema carpocapsae]|uniref:Uncharacterized protein n=1 Tax=Steinernema carpocapsae TaxID=34508 RepID=A0A4U5NIK6_STECR|nr:hypothetical protein L596_016306 [Steinernema carpocapsae]